MKRPPILCFLVGAIGTTALCAQSVSYPDEARQFYTSIRDNLLAAAEKMPEDAYAFKATADVRTFGQLIAHVADSNLVFCSVVKGEEKKGDAGSKATKSDLSTALKESFTYCDTLSTSTPIRPLKR
jgi:uncharacterized damage-inducible protein DinB